MSTGDNRSHIRWTAKGTAFKIWQVINIYVDFLTTNDLFELESNWYHRCYNIYNVGLIRNPKTPCQVASFAIAKNPKATNHLQLPQDSVGTHPYPQCISSSI